MSVINAESDFDAFMLCIFFRKCTTRHKNDQEKGSALTEGTQVENTTLTALRY